MAQTPNLLIDHVVTGQAKKELTLNTALDAIDRATQGYKVIDVSTIASVVVGLDDYLENFCLRVAGSTGAAVTVTLPPSGNRFFCIDNGSDGTITAGIAGGTGSVILDPGQTKVMLAIGTRLAEITTDSGDAGAPALSVSDPGGVVSASTARMTFEGPGVSVSGAAGGVTVRVSTAAETPPFAAMLYVDGQPGANEAVARLALPYAVSFASAFAGSVAKVQTAPTSTCAFTIRRSGTLVGTVTFVPGTTAGTFAITETDEVSVGVHFASTGAASGWNQITSLGGTSHDNLPTRDGTATAIDLIMQGSWNSFQTNGVAGTTGLPSGMYQRWMAKGGGATNTLRWEGLDAATTYRIKIYVTRNDAFGSSWDVGPFSAMTTKTWAASTQSAQLWTGLVPESNALYMQAGTTNSICAAELLWDEPAASVAYATGDLLEVVAASTADATLAGVSITLYGTRS